MKFTLPDITCTDISQIQQLNGAAIKYANGLVSLMWPEDERLRSASCVLIAFESEDSRRTIGAPVMTLDGELLIQAKGLENIIGLTETSLNLEQEPWFKRAPHWNESGFGSVIGIRNSIRTINARHTDPVLRQSFLRIHTARTKVGLEPEIYGTHIASGGAALSNLSTDLLKLGSIVCRLSCRSSHILSVVGNTPPGQEHLLYQVSG